MRDLSPSSTAVAVTTADANKANKLLGFNDGIAALSPSSAACPGTVLNSIDERFEIPSPLSPPDSGRASSKVIRVNSTENFSNKTKKYSARVDELRQSRQRHFSDRYEQNDILESNSLLCYENNHSHSDTSNF